MADPSKIVRWTVEEEERATVWFEDGRVDWVGIGCCPSCKTVLDARPEILAAIAAFVPPPKVDPKVASEQARSLLMSVLPEKERERLTEEGFFLFKGQSGNNYRITYGVSGNIIDIDKGRYYCCYISSRQDLPYYDHMLAQYLAIKYNEKHFLSKAI